MILITGYGMSKVYGYHKNCATICAKCILSGLKVLKKYDQKIEIRIVQRIY